MLQEIFNVTLKIKKQWQCLNNPMLQPITFNNNNENNTTVNIQKILTWQYVNNSMPRGNLK